MAIGGIIGDGHAEAGLADVHPAVGNGFETGHVPRRVRVCRAEDMAELNFGGGPVDMQIEREVQPQQLLPFLPVDAEGEVDGARLARQGHVFDQRGCAEPTGDAHTDPTGRQPIECLDRLSVGERGERARVRGIDVPGVPLGGRIAVQREQVASGTGRHDLAAGVPIAHRTEEPVVVDRDGHIRVGQHPAGGSAGDPGQTVNGRVVDRGRGVEREMHPAERWHVAERVRPGVEQHLPVTGSTERTNGCLDHPLEYPGDPRILVLRLSVHPGDRRPGKNVVKLMQQYGLPGLFEGFTRILRPHPNRGRRRPQFRLP